MLSVLNPPRSLTSVLLAALRHSRSRRWLAAWLMLAILGSQWVGLQHGIAHAGTVSHAAFADESVGDDHHNDNHSHPHSCAAWDALTGIGATPPVWQSPTLLSFTHTLIARTLAQILPASARSTCWARAPPL